MKLRGMGESDLRAIVKAVSESTYGGNLIVDAGGLRTVRRPGTNFVLRVKSSRGPGARRSGRGRRTVAACWHAHRDVMRLIFAAAPTARLTSALADYRDRIDFEEKFPATAEHNVGSVYEPCSIASCCDCVEGRPVRRTPIQAPRVSHDAMRWDPRQADDEIAEWARILHPPTKQL